MEAALTYAPSNGELKDSDMMDHSEVQRMFEVWQATAQRQHEDFTAGIHALEALLEQTKDEFLSRIGTAHATASWWRAMASALIGLCVGLLGAGLPMVQHFNDIDTTLARTVARQEMVLSEIMGLKVADTRTLEALERLKELVIQAPQSPAPAKR